MGGASHSCTAGPHKAFSCCSESLRVNNPGLSETKGKSLISWRVVTLLCGMVPQSSAPLTNCFPLWLCNLAALVRPGTPFPPRVTHVSPAGSHATRKGPDPPRWICLTNRLLLSCPLTPVRPFLPVHFLLTVNPRRAWSREGWLGEREHCPPRWLFSFLIF